MKSILMLLFLFQFCLQSACSIPICSNLWQQNQSNVNDIHTITFGDNIISKAKRYLHKHLQWWQNKNSSKEKQYPYKHLQTKGKQNGISTSTSGDNQITSTSSDNGKKTKLFPHNHLQWQQNRRCIHTITSNDNKRKTKANWSQSKTVFTQLPLVMATL